jgi:hypothetical protein
MSDIAQLSTRRFGLLLVVIVLLALLPRLYGAAALGRDWYAPGSFTLVNFDEGGSCRAALGGFAYTPFVGWQTVAIARFTGAAPAPGVRGDPRAVKAYCHGEAHLRVARAYSALLGTLTLPATALLALQLFPGRRRLALASAALLGASGWHVGESIVGTVDAASTAAITAFLAALAWALRRDASSPGAGRWLLALLLLVPALWTKYWVFALLGTAALLPAALWRRLLGDASRGQLAVLLLALTALFGLVSNPALPVSLVWLLPPLFYLAVPWSRLPMAGRWAALLLPWLAPLAMQVELFVAFTAGGLEGRFGTDYGAIGWHKWLRNAINLPAVLAVGLSLPGFVALVAGARALWREPLPGRPWLALLPLLAFFLYMLALAPVTYYRHYLPLLPLACIVAAWGVWQLRRVRRVQALSLLLGWQLLLAWDLVSDYHLDPRRQLPALYAQLQPQRVAVSFYVNPPPASGASHQLFRAAGPGGVEAGLHAAQLLILSENWYDTAFANELNGPLVRDPAHLIKTTPAAARFYRDALADDHPRLQELLRLRPPSVMPELLLHRAFYGSFTQFVGDLVIFRVRPAR